jgi:hypothetical protein
MQHSNHSLFDDYDSDSDSAVDLEANEASALMQRPAVQSAYSSHQTNVQSVRMNAINHAILPNIVYGDNGEQPQQHNGQGVNETLPPGSERLVKVSQYFMTLLSLTQVSLTSYTLYKYWDPGHCDAPLDIWMCGHVLICLMQLKTGITQCLTARLAPSNDEQKWRKVVRQLSFIWLMFGYFYVLSGEVGTEEANNCPEKEKDMYQMFYYLIYIEVYQRLLPWFLVCLIIPIMCCSMPFLLRSMTALGVTNSSAERGVTQGNIDSTLESTVYAANSLDEPSCAICIAEYDVGDSLRVLPCDTQGRHHFHTTCIDSWLNVNDSCPICREKVVHAQGHITV